jgi:hypothetical protein
MDKIEQNILASLVSNKNNGVTDSGYEYKSLFLSKVLPDESNPRYFPAIIISDKHANQVVKKQLSKRQLIELYSAENKVVIGKSCIVNCCESGSAEWKKSNQTISSIIELGENIAVSEVIQAPTVFPTDEGYYQLLTGHRRFFAMIFAHGIEGAAHFKVYYHKPLLHKVKQFQENASREDLPQYGKLQAFMTAMYEIETLNRAKKRLGEKPLTVRETVSVLGISAGAFDNYNVLVRYPAIISAYENGNSHSFFKMKKMILDVEQGYKNEHNIKILNVSDKRQINNTLSEILNGSSKPKNTKNTAQYYTLGKLHSPSAIYKLLSTNILDVVCGVDWKEVDWNNINEVNDSIQKVLNHLSESQTENN